MRTLFSLLIMTTLGASASIANVGVRPRDADATYRAYARAEWVVDPGRQYDNPFDPDEIAIDARFTAPGGDVLTIPAFWNQDFESTPQGGDPHQPRPRGEPHWLVRFTPTQPGAWAMEVVARERGGSAERRSTPITFQVAASDAPGFVRRARANERYFQFDNGKTYFPIGINLAWPDRRGRADRIAQWMGLLAKNGGNFARVWMCHPPVMLESDRTGLGHYDLFAADYFDEILQAGERHGLAVMLTFVNHRDLIDEDMWGKAIWPSNPYNAALRGPATRPVDFFAHAEARRRFRQRLRYIVARYAAYTSVMCWELMNEQEYARVEVPDAWNAEMAAYLKQVDPYDHLVSTSSKLPDAVWQLPQIDLTQRHMYGDGSQIDVISPIAGGARDFERFGKPHLLAEFGLDFKGTDANFDPDGRATTLHNSLWSAALSGHAGATAYWWWDSYVDAKNLWHVYAPLARFASQIDWAKRKFEPIDLPAPPSRDTTEPERFSDLSVTSSLGWGKAHGRPIAISRGGAVNMPVPRFLYGPRQEKLRTPTTLEVDLPADGAMTMRFARVSDHAMLRVSVDGKPIADFGFSAQPQSPDQKNAKPAPGHPDVLQADLNVERTIQLKSGRHSVALDNIAGDWVALDSITFAGAKSSRLADLSAIAMRDEQTGQTIAWLLDATSNWRNDRDGPQSSPQRDVLLTLPALPKTVAASSQLVVEWWDTRAGRVVEKQTVSPGNGELRLRVPTFTRDIALRATPVAATSSSSSP